MFNWLRFTFQGTFGQDRIWNIVSIVSMAGNLKCLAPPGQLFNIFDLHVIHLLWRTPYGAPSLARVVVKGKSESLLSLKATYPQLIILRHEYPRGAPEMVIEQNVLIDPCGVARPPRYWLAERREGPDERALGLLNNGKTNVRLILEKVGETVAEQLGFSKVVHF